MRIVANNAKTIHKISTHSFYRNFTHVGWRYIHPSFERVVALCMVSGARVLQGLDPSGIESQASRDGALHGRVQWLPQHLVHVIDCVGDVSLPPTWAWSALAPWSSQSGLRGSTRENPCRSCNLHTSVLGMNMVEDEKKGEVETSNRDYTIHVDISRGVFLRRQLYRYL